MTHGPEREDRGSALVALETEPLACVPSASAARRSPRGAGELRVGRAPRPSLCARGYSAREYAWDAGCVPHGDSDAGERWHLRRSALQPGRPSESLPPPPGCWVLEPQLPPRSRAAALPSLAPKPSPSALAGALRALPCAQGPPARAALLLTLGSRALSQAALGGGPIGVSPLAAVLRSRTLPFKSLHTVTSFSRDQFFVLKELVWENTCLG